MSASRPLSSLRQLDLPVNFNLTCASPGLGRSPFLSKFLWSRSCSQLRFSLQTLPRKLLRFAPLYHLRLIWHCQPLSCRASFHPLPQSLACLLCCGTPISTVRNCLRSKNLPSGIFLETDRPTSPSTITTSKRAASVDSRQSPLRGHLSNEILIPFTSLPARATFSVKAVFVITILSAFA